jgi:hypothetical protein
MGGSIVIVVIYVAILGSLEAGLITAYRAGGDAEPSAAKD